MDNRKKNLTNDQGKQEEHQEQQPTNPIDPLSLSLNPPPPPPPPPPPSPPPPMAQPDPSDPDYIPSPYPWSRPRRASVHTLHHLLSSGCDTITGRLRCKRCDVTVEVAHDLRDRFMEVARFVSAERPRMHDRAPPVWMKPRLPTCQNCRYANAMKPVIAPKKRNINWLFLLLGQMLGCCSLAQLKYFCKHNSNHRTGAKDRVLYLTYLNLCKQLDPTGPFDR